MQRLAALGVALWLAAVSPAAQPAPKVEPPPRAAATRPLPAIDKAFVSFRIGVPQWLPEKRFRELLALFEKHKGVTDEITFFTSATHPPLPLDEVRRRCEVLALRVAEARALGYRAGINVLATMGHHNENLPNSLSADFTRVTDIAGGVSQGSFCPNDPGFQEYVRELYRLAAKANPDYLWVDDDVRLAGHMPVGLTCFCDRCLAIFERESGVKYTRAGLRAAGIEGPPEKHMPVRKAWLAHNRATIGRLLGLVERTVHEVKPGLPLGFMTGDRFFEGYDFDGWAETLAGPQRAPVYWRPGGGFYEDSWTAGLVGKSHEIGRQVAFLPPSVRSIQSEIENFPYQRLKKAGHITVLEAASHLGAGCTGAAFNVLSGNDEPLDEFEPLVARIRQARPLLDLLARHLGRAPPVGLFAVWNKDIAAGAGGDWFAGGNYAGFFPPQVFEIGLPPAYHPDSAVAAILSPQAVAVLSNDQLTRILSSGVYLDAETLDALNRRGLQELTGLAVETPLPVDCIEEFTAHPLNGPFAGRQRDCRQSFNHLAGYALKRLDPKAQTLARLVDYGGKEKAATSMAVFENRLGGRVCVCAYFPWTFLHSLSKSSQMKSVMRWLSRDRLPAYAVSYHKVNLWARQPGDGRIAIALVNASFDPAEDLVLAVRTGAQRIRVLDMDAAERVVESDGQDGPYRHFRLPRVDAWSVRLVVAGP
ncbi:MAG: hypothetical protein NUV77_13685 [Thermoguttaceae bacterium]|jgi:hypothetical protein|nr:hypothetical protein [Thermoguttaceae bacterium]